MTIEREKFERLMTAALDGELTAEERREFEALLDENEELRREYLEYQQLKEVTSTMRLKMPSQEVWDRYWLDVYNRIERGISWVLISIGAAVLLAYGGYKLVEEILKDTSLSWAVRLAALSLMGGLALLLVSVAREKWFTRKSDPYKEVLR
ncbi:MAG: zf-HC2 domain-containing protein [candidate division KSB1 bacterium]|nr:zf-HC2 domain-containing protein [candidate division KSB1 bacterium]